MNPGHQRFRGAYGGRGSAKSWSFASGLVQIGSWTSKRILCTRELQNSIKDSVHRLLCDTIYRLKLESYFDIKKDYISGVFGSEFLFKGLRHSISEIKSTEGIDIVWVEEAEKVSKESWEILIPTVRKAGSEIWVTFNPEDENSPTYQRFVVNPSPDVLAAEVNWDDNDFFPEVLRTQKDYDYATDPELAEHIWGGKPKKYLKALIFGGKYVVDEFESPPPDYRRYYGMDFGFSDDPTAIGRMFIKDNTLFLEHEFYGHHVEINELDTALQSVPDSRRWPIYADQSRPETISYLAGMGYNIKGADKGPGSVEDGIQFLRSFEKIVIHPRCKGAALDYGNYRWKTDPKTGEILPIPIDKQNHWPDLTRYALFEYIKRKVSILDLV